MDRTKRSSSSNNWKTENNKRIVENGKMGSREKRECSNENPMYLDEYGKIASEMGIVV